MYIYKIKSAKCIEIFNSTASIYIAIHHKSMSKKTNNGSKFWKELLKSYTKLHRHDLRIKRVGQKETFIFYAITIYGYFWILYYSFLPHERPNINKGIYYVFAKKTHFHT